MRLVYVDDSGDRNLTLYCLLEVKHEDWAPGLQQWLDMRKQLRDEVAIPVRYELHAVDFLGGRGNPSLDESWNRARHQRNVVGLRVARALADMPVRWRVVYVNRRDRLGAYSAALIDLESDLKANDDHALVMVDGDGTEPAYREAHRELDITSRRVIEDPWHQGSQTSQWIMMSDWVAYLAFQQIRNTSNPYSHWYVSHLTARDVHGGPIQG